MGWRKEECRPQNEAPDFSSSNAGTAKEKIVYTHINLGRRKTATPPGLTVNYV